jgi:hypothetical protein
MRTKSSRGGFAAKRGPAAEVRVFILTRNILLLKILLPLHMIIYYSLL